MADFFMVYSRVCTRILQYFIFQYAVAGYWVVTFGAVGSFLIGLDSSSSLIFLLVQDLLGGKSAAIEGRTTSSRKSSPRKALPACGE